MGDAATGSRTKAGKGCMMKFGIVSDSSCDLAQEYTEKEKVTIVPFYVSFDGENYYREGKEIPVTEFYRKMEAQTGCYPKTSMPSVQDYRDAFLPYVMQGCPVLCICLTKTFSGSMQAALNAKQELAEEYPDAVIEVMDSQLVTVLQGMLVKEAVKLRNQGRSLEEAMEALAPIRSTGHIFFTTKDLKYLEHGGRIRKAASIAGSVLNIKPLLQYYDGELASPEICRGRKKSLQKMMEMFFSYIEKHQIRLEEYHLATGVGLPVAEYETFKQQLREGLQKRGYHVTEWEEIQIGATIGVHTGPYPMGVGFLKRCQ